MSITKLISTYCTTTFMGGCIIGYYHGKSRYHSEEREKIIYEAIVTACFSPIILPIHIQNYLNNPDMYKRKKCPYIDEIR